AAVTPATAAPEAAMAIRPAVEVKKAPFFFDDSMVDTTTPVIAAPGATEIGALEPMISPEAFTISTVKLPAASPGNENWPAASLVVVAASCPVSRSRRRTVALAMLRPLGFLTEPDIELLAGAWAAPAAKTDEVPAMDTTSARARTRFITTSLTCRSGLPLTNRQTIVCRASLSPPRARSA